MRQYLASKIRNLAIVGHCSAGKTSLAEAMLYKANITDRLGTIAEQNTVCDYEQEETKRKTSVNTALAPLTWGSVKINLVDTPGLFDFQTGFYEGISACESVLIVVSGKSGVSVGSEKAYKAAEKLGKSRMIFVNKLDSTSADFYKVLEQLKIKFGPSICPIFAPFMVGDNVDCYINLITDKAYKFSAVDEYSECPMPDTGHKLDGLKAAIYEAVAETSEELFEKYFSGEEFTRTEILTGLHEGVKTGAITPVICGSAQNLEGIETLLDGICDYLPSAWENGDANATNEEGNPILVKCTDEAPFSGYIFKTVSDPFVGKQSYLKIVSGKVAPGQMVHNARTGEQEKVSKIVLLRGKKPIEMTSVTAGDICVLLKLSNTATGDTLCDSSFKVEYDKVEFAKPSLSMAVKAVKRGDEPKIVASLAKILDEDPCMRFFSNTETHEYIVTGLGEQHLDVILNKLKNKYSVDAKFETPMIAYRETIKKKVNAEGKHKKQSGGHGQYGHVLIRFEPNGYSDLVFDEEVVGGKVPKNYFPAVEKGLEECVKSGVLAGYPLIGLKAVLYDGSYHDVDSSEMAFKQAVGIAYKNGIKDAGPVILEPIHSVKIYVPDEYTGDIIGEINKRRGHILGMEKNDELQAIFAEAPISEMHDFLNKLRQISHDRGYFEMEFERYDELQANLAEKVIAQAKQQADA